MFVDYRVAPETVAMQLNCQLQAGLLIYKQRTGKLSHEQVKAAIDAAPPLEQECLRAWCNHYRRIGHLEQGGAR